MDANRIRQVLANLVENASKVGASAIVVGAELLDAELVCWVADNGPGIPLADQPRIFDRYWRVMPVAVEDMRLRESSP